MVVDADSIPTVCYQDLLFGRAGEYSPQTLGEEGESLLFVAGGIMEKRRGTFSCTWHQSIPQYALQSLGQEDLGVC